MSEFPQSKPSTVSHWQETNRGPTSLWNHGRDAPLPTNEVADFVIIGAGVTGVSLAYQLSRPGGAAEGKKVVLLDAKDVAAGASGRNGGHVAPYGWQVFSMLMTELEEGGGSLTAEEVLDLIFFELDTLDLVTDIVQKEAIDADWWRGSRLEVITTPDSAAANLRHYKLLKRMVAASPKYRDRPVDWEIITDPAEAKRVSRIHNAIMVNRLPGACWHPHRGVTAILRRALDSKCADVKFFSWAPVFDIRNNADGTIGVDCGDRGTVTGRKVIVGTNGYTKYLLPELEPLLVPYRAQAGRVVPPPSYSGPRALQTTYAVQEGPYLMQTAHSGIVFGPYVELDRGSNIYGIDDDSATTKPYRDWLESWCRNNYIGWGPESVGEGLVKQWAGIICHSVDCLPYVGEVPGRPNVWVAAGYSGHGMAQIVNITRGLNVQFKTGKWDETIPRTFEITDERLKRARERAVHPLDFDARNVTTGPLAHHQPEIKGDNVARL